MQKEQKTGMSPTCTPDKLFRYNTIYLYLRMVLFKNLTIMKNRLLPMLALVTFCLWTGNSANAQVIHSMKYSKKGDLKKEVKMLKGDDCDISIRKVKNESDDTEKVNVTFELKYSPDKYIPSYFAAYNSDVTIEEYYMGEDKFVMSVSKGEYDFICDFWKMEETGMSLAHIIKELITVNKDTTLVFDVADITKHIVIESYNPVGELCYASKYDKESYEIVEEGTVDDMMILSSLILKGYGFISQSTGNTGSVAVGEKDRSSYYDFYVNELSNRYILAQTRTAVKGGVFYVNKFTTEGTITNKLQNDPNEFYLYEEDFKFSPLGENNKQHFPRVSISSLYNNIEVGKTEMSFFEEDYFGSNKFQAYIDAYKENTKNDHRYDLMIYPEIGDYTYSYVMSYPVGDIIRNDTIVSEIYNIGLPVFIYETDIEYVNKGHDIYGNYAFQVPEEGDILEYPGHPAFTYTDKQKIGIYGNSSPINAFMAQNSFNEYFNWKYSYLSPCYIGRLGEIRMSDFYALKMSMKHNGEEVTDNFNQLDSLMTAWAEEKQPYGEIDLTLTNENVDVDGIPGYNLTRIIYDQRKEDWTAPTLQMLHFKSTDGMITDRFEVPQDGLLEFCGGDFNFHNENNRTYFDCKEQTVAVAYSPYGQDNWTELAVDEIPELYRMPGFGYFYRGSLESVNRESSNGWYDLKVTLTDASGNMQEQTISPAFRIANTTGVSETLQGTMNLRHEGGQIYVTGTEKAGLTIYSVDGTCVMKVADAVSRPVSASDIKPGMYVVKATSADGNQIVKKITVR